MNTSSAAATSGDEEETGGAEEIGSELRRQREARGYTLADVEAYLRIRRSYLEAIEAGRFADLPGTTYLMGFVRSYARFLELDADDIVARVRASQSGEQPRYSLPLLASGREGSLAGIATLLVATGAVALAIGGWYYFSSNNLSITDLGKLFEDNPAATPDPVGPAPRDGEPATADAAPPGDEPVSNPAQPAAGPPDAAGEPPPASAETAPADGARTATSDSAETAPADSTETAPADSAGEAQVAAGAPDPAPGGTAPTTAPQPAEGTPAAASAEAPPDASPASQPAAEPAAPAGEGATPQVVLEATGETFIALRTPGGEIFLSRLLRAGETYEIPPEHPQLILDTGNAGTLRIVVDGRTLPPLGAVGAVVRDIPLDPRELLERGR